MDGFDTIINRRKTNSCKWDLGGDDILPLWVADMDFAVCQPIQERMEQIAKHGVFGYTTIPDSFFQSLVNWQSRRNEWKIQNDWIVYSPGIVPALNLLVRALTQPGDRIIVQPPVYYPFFSAVENNGCQIVENPLVYDDAYFTMDFSDLREKAAHPRAKLMILCSPHNPVGRVWRPDELEELGDICMEHGITVISDEIHSDLIYSGHTHTPFASLSEQFLNHSITCVSPSKTFNIAGLQASGIIIKDPDMRKRFQNAMQNAFMVMPNPFGVAAFETAYTRGESWLDELMNYLEENLAFMIEFIEEHLPKVKVIQPEGTYLVWLDFTNINLAGKKLDTFLMEDAKVWLDGGTHFGGDSEHCARINIACPRKTLREALIRITNAVNTIT